MRIRIRIRIRNPDANQSAVKEDCFNLLLLGMRSFLPGKPKAPTLEEIQELKESVPNSPKFRLHKSIKWLIFIVSNSDSYTHCCVSASGSA